jgi:hypothetical protein
MSGPIDKYFAAKFFIFGWFFLTASPVFLVKLLCHGDQDKLGRFEWITTPWAILAFLLSCWLGKITAHYTNDENKSPLDAIKWTLCELRFKLVFLPVVGHLFASDEDKTHYEAADDQPTPPSTSIE